MKTRNMDIRPMNASRLIGTALLALGATAASAQDASTATMPAMDHSQMQAAPAADMPATMDHSQMNHGTTPDMDHGSMPAQDDSAPAEARDPHAYSGGFGLTTGPYALDGPRQLRLADEHSFASLMLNRLERVDTRDATFTAWDARARIGRDYDALVIKSEGEYGNGELEHARTEVLWQHALTNFWNTQLGWRHDSGATPDQDWLAVGIEGLAPYWFEVDATAYLGKGGQSALRLEGEYELLITQRLILQPRAELTAYGQRDDAQDVASGLADITAGIRLRYEFSRQFAPYAGVEWQRLLGGTADIARDAGENPRQTRWVVGVRMWF